MEYNPSRSNGSENTEGTIEVPEPDEIDVSEIADRFAGVWESNGIEPSEIEYQEAHDGRLYVIADGVGDVCRKFGAVFGYDAETGRWYIKPSEI